MSSKEKNQAPGAEVRPLAALKVWKVAQRTRYTMVTALLLDLVGGGVTWAWCLQGCSLKICTCDCTCSLKTPHNPTKEKKARYMIFYTPTSALILRPIPCNLMKTFIISNAHSLNLEMKAELPPSTGKGRSQIIREALCSLFINTAAMTSGSWKSIRRQKVWQKNMATGFSHDPRGYWSLPFLTWCPGQC